MPKHSIIQNIAIVQNSTITNTSFNACTLIAVNRQSCLHIYPILFKKKIINSYYLRFLEGLVLFFIYYNLYEKQKICSHSKVKLHRMYLEEGCHLMYHFEQTPWHPINQNKIKALKALLVITSVFHFFLLRLTIIVDPIY